MGHPIKQSVALLVRAPGDPRRVLLVLRPQTPGEELPGVWGLPAATLQPGETEEAAALRVGLQKLGCPVRLGRVLGRGVQDRPGYRLHMAVYEAELRDVPRLPDAPEEASATYYVAWRFGQLEDLEEAVRCGSLCARVAVEAARGQVLPCGSSSSTSNRSAE